MRDRRCNFFDDLGIPRVRHTGDLGCPRATGVCRFVHPDEPLWRDLVPVAPPPPHLAVDQDLPPPRGASLSPARRLSIRDPNDRDRDRRMSGSTEGPSRRENRSPPRHRSLEHRRRSRSPAASSTSDDRAWGRYHRDVDSSRLKYGDYDRRGRHDSEDRKRDERSDYHRGERVQPSSEPRTIPAPPPPATPVPLPPPRPLPRPPPFLSDSPLKAESENMPATDPLTDAEKRAVWLERSKLLANFVTAHSERRKLESELDSLRRLTKSWRYESIGDEEKSAMDARLADIDSKCEAKTEEISATIMHLMETDFWPVLRQPDAQAIETKFKEIKAFVGELKDAVTKMNDTVHAIVAVGDGGKSVRPKQEGERMDVSRQEDHPLPPKKRRRISTGDEGGRLNTDTQTLPTIVSPNDLEEIQDRLLGFERRLSDMENDLLQHEADLFEEVTVRIDAKIEQLGTAPPSVLSQPYTMKTDTQGDALALQSEKVRLVEQNINLTGDQLGELAEEVGNVIIRTSTTEAEVARLAQENADLRQSYAELEQKLETYHEVQERDQKEMRAINAALTVHLSRPPSPPPALHMLPFESIFESIEKPLLQSVRSHVQSLLDELRSNVNEMLQTRNSEMYETLWSKLSLTLQLVQAISERLGQDSPDTHNITNGDSWVT